MSGINLANLGSSVVESVPTPLVYVADSWGAEWELQDLSTFESVVVYSGSEGTDRLEFSTFYGTGLTPISGGGFQTQGSQDLEGKWAKLDLVDPAGGLTTVFVGQIRGSERQVFGSDTDVAPAGQTPPKPKGFQTWHALGGQVLLKLTAISTSFWKSIDGSSSTELGWTPGFNARDPEGLLRGNRSDAASPDDSGTYVFGGTSTWTRRQAVDYVIKRFLNRSQGGENPGPKWTIGGQVDVLAGNLRLLDIGHATNADDLLRRIISHKEGIDFGVAPSFDSDGGISGYEIRAFTLVAKDVTFLGATIPANPNTVSFSTKNMRTVESLKIASDRTHTPSRVRIVGDRIVVCASLLGPTLAGAPGDDVLTSTNATLIGKWTSGQEATYKAGDPNRDPTDFGDLHDAARMNEVLRPVYQRYGLPQGYDRPKPWRPAFDGNMNRGDYADYQDVVRETLSWIPLLEGVDYTQGVPADHNPTGDPVEFRSPFVLCEDRKAELETDGNATTTLWGAAEHMGVSHSALKKDLGVQLHASPAHKLALNRCNFDGTDGAESRLDFLKDEGEGHAIDARTLAVTIAWKIDQRFRLEFALDGATDDGTAIEISEPDAQLWWLAPSTIVGVVNEQVVKSPASGLILRNDADLFAPQMAGVIARYLFARTRADFVFHGWRPWLQLLGSVLETVEEGGGTLALNAPITCVELRGGRNAQPKTLVRAGFAA